MDNLYDEDNLYGILQGNIGNSTKRLRDNDKLIGLFQAILAKYNKAKHAEVP